MTGRRMEVVIDTGSGGLAQPLRRLGKYELIAKIASGGMAEVYLARQRGPMNFTKVVVVKVIHPHLASQRHFLQMLLDEARLSAAIKHPRVVDVYELGRSEGIYFMAMEYLDGEPLSSILHEGLAGNRLDPLSTARVVADVAEGLHAAHELSSGSGANLGLVHRDVSPGNIVVLYDGTAKIVDFGIAKARGRISVSGAQQFKGKLGYVAPEQIAGGSTDRRADVFALGVVMWEALSVRRLYPGELDRSGDPGAAPAPQPPSMLDPSIPDALSDICVRALATDPADRYQTAGEMQSAIEAVLHAAGYYRELGAIRDHMERVFGVQREQRQRKIRRLGDISREVAIQPGESQGEIDLDEVVDRIREDRMAGGTPVGDGPATVSEPGPRRRRRTWRLLALGLLAGLAATIGFEIVRTELDRRGATPRPTPAPRRESRAPVVAPAPPTPQPAADAPQPAADAPPPAPRPAAAAPAAEVEAASTPPRERPASRGDERDRAGSAAPTRSAKQLYTEGYELFVQGHAGEAKKRFKQALQVDSRYAPAYRGLGMAYSADGKTAKAVSAFRRYVALRPSASDAASIRKRIEQLEK